MALAAQADTATIVSRIDLKLLGQNVGGLSGLDVSADGTSVTLLSDRGFAFRADLIRDDNGSLAAAKLTDTQRLRHNGEHRHPDSEGLTIGANDTFHVSAEGPTRVLTYIWGNKDPDYLPDIPTVRDLESGNRGLEALAQSPNGAFWTLFETADPDGTFPLYALQDGVWSEQTRLPETPGFSIVGADFDAQGRLFLLERAFSLIGFRIRIRMLEPLQDGAQSQEIFSSALGEHDNFEGIAIWHPAPSETRILLVSDDNYTPILKSEMLELRLKH